MAGVTVEDLAKRLSVAFWERFQSSGTGVVEVFSSNYQPTSEVEHQLWEQLTSPSHRGELTRYVSDWEEVGVNDFAARLHRKLLEESDRRSGSDGSETR